jgi:hypothetical protein
MELSYLSEALGDLLLGDKKLEEQSLLPLLPSYLSQPACQALQFPLQSFPVFRWKLLMQFQEEVLRRLEQDEEKSNTFSEHFEFTQA